MRPHTKRPRPIPPRPWGPFVPLDPATQEQILEEAAFSTYTCLHDYATCQLCGNAVAWPETLAATLPPAPLIPVICWRCLVSILINRGAIDPETEALPPQYSPDR